MGINWDNLFDLEPPFEPAHREACSPSCREPAEPAHVRTSGENVLVVLPVMAPSSQELGSGQSRGASHWSKTPGASERQMFMLVTLPGAVSIIFSGLRLGPVPIDAGSDARRNIDTGLKTITLYQMVYRMNIDDACSWSFAAHGGT